ncbi:MAG TPA: hypothetical protein VF250_11050 [Conexibacter sp.]
MAHDETTPGGSADGGVAEDSWTAAEQALLEAALDFYAAAEGVIDLAGRERPQLRHDAAGFEAVRRAMGALEQRVAAARAAGSSPQRIAQIARIEQETIDLILQRQDAAPTADER